MLPNINLLPEYERQNSFLYILFWVGLIICFILFGVLGYFYFTEKNSLEETEKTLQELNEEKTLLEERLASITSEEETGTIEGAATYVEHHLIPTSNFIDELITLLPDNSYLSNYNYNYQTVNVETQFEKMGDAAVYISALIDSEFVRDIKVDEMYTYDLSSGESEEEVNDEEMFDVIPRYNVSYSIDVNQPYLKEEGEEDE